MTERPPGDFGDGFPEMSENSWLSDPYFDLGKISQLFSIANQSLFDLYGDYNLHLDPDNVLNFDNVNFDSFTDESKRPIVYISLWLVAAIIFTIVGIVWCFCNKCCCCSRGSYKDKSRSGGDNYQNSFKPSTGTIVVSVLMAIWLLALIVVIGHTFDTNEKTQGTFHEIQMGIDNGIMDIGNFVLITLRQLAFILEDGFKVLEEKIEWSVLNMDCDGSVDCDSIKKKLQEDLENRYAESKLELNETSTSLGNALLELQEEMNQTKTVLDEDFEDVMTRINNGMYWFFMLFNLAYLLIFILVLTGSLLALFSRRNRLKIMGHLIIRVAVVIMFVVSIVVVVQMLVMFIFSGVITEIICPAIRELEEERPATSTPIPDSSVTGLKKIQSGYQIPNYAEIMRACKEDESAYAAFNLESAYSIEDLKTELEKLFDSLEIPSSASGVDVNNSVIRPLKANVKVPINQTIDDIQRYVSDYADFVVESVKEKIGKCFPAYNVVNSTLTLFCHKIPAPVTAFWWILQYLPITFLFIIITALVFERV